MTERKTSCTNLWSGSSWKQLQSHTVIQEWHWRHPVGGNKERSRKWCSCPQASCWNNPKRDIPSIIQTYSCKGYLLDEQYDKNPSFLIALVQMILGATSVENKTVNNKDVESAALSITQLLVFNTMKCIKKNNNAVWHNLDRETRLPLYLGLLLHKCHKADLKCTQLCFCGKQCTEQDTQW